MKHVRFIALFLATTVVVLHSIVPHNHHCDLSPEEHAREHASANSILDFIALGFHGDHSEGQWEDFNASKQIQSQGSEVIESESKLLVLSEYSELFESNVLNQYFNSSVIRRGLWDSDVLRGPPALV